MAGVSIARRMLDDQELMRKLLARYTLKECAALLGVSYPTACSRARRPEFLLSLKELDQKLYEELDHELTVVRGQISERVLDLSEKALNVLEKLIDEEGDNRLRAKIAMDFLDRNPSTSKTSKSMVENRHVFDNPLVLKHAAAAAQEMDDNTHPPTLDAHV